MYKKVEPLKVDSVDWNETKSVEGVVTKIAPAKYGMSYLLKTKKGEKTIYANKQLQQLMELSNVAIGTKIKVDFKGMQKTKDGTNSFRTFELFVDDGE